MKTNITLRPAQPRDARAIIEVHHCAVRSAAADYYPDAVIDDWAPRAIADADVQQFGSAIERQEEVVLLAQTDGGDVVGFGSIVPSRAELRAVYVAGAYGRRGIGRLILAGLEERARQSGVSALHLDASINAERFYTSNGYEPLERANHLLQSGRQMACVRMQKRLS